MKKLLSQTPLFLPLLSVFFVLHAFQESFEFMSLNTCLYFITIYLLTSALLFFIFYLVYKSSIKAALLSFFLVAFYFFFGILHNFTREHIPLLHKYSIIIPVFIAGIAFLFMYLKKTSNPFYRLTLFLNCLLVIYLLLDLGKIYEKNRFPYREKILASSLSPCKYNSCIQCNKPDIYFLLFDEYASSLSLDHLYNYNNNDLDSFLLHQGFSIQRTSTSNYNFTPFSMASILNMSYLKNVQAPRESTLDDYAECFSLIKYNRTVQFLTDQGYDIINYSTFDLANYPSIADDDLVPLKTSALLDRTLFSIMKKEIGWRLLNSKFQWLADKWLFLKLHNNDMFIEQIKKETTVKREKPRFVYLHLTIPHDPIYYNKNGSLKKTPIDYINNSSVFINAYLDYLPYANSKAKEIISAIQQNTGGKAVIVFMGDHGFRKERNALASTKGYFQNQNAVYFPDKDYNLLYDSITGVNQFRIIFNKFFQQNFPLLKDSTVYLIDKK